MSTNGKHRRKYTPEYRREAAKLVIDSCQDITLVLKDVQTITFGIHVKQDIIRIRDLSSEYHPSKWILNHSLNESTQRPRTIDRIESSRAQPLLCGIGGRLSDGLRQRHTENAFIARRSSTSNSTGEGSPGC